MVCILEVWGEKRENACGVPIGKAFFLDKTNYMCGVSNVR